MKIVISTWGSTGDIQPYLALSRRLLEVGHQVRVCTSDIYHDRFTALGVDFYKVGSPFDEDRFNKTIDAVIQIKDPLKSALLIAKDGILYKADEWYQDCLKGMHGYDLAICHYADIPGQEAAIRQRLPWITACLCPGFFKTVYEAPAPLPNLGVGLNTIAWKFVERMMRKHFDPLFNTFIESIGGKKRESIGLESMYSPELNLIAASPHISPPNPDLPRRHQYTGPWFLDEPEEKLPPHLDEFLARGSKPIVISFGSMGGTSPFQTTSLLVDAVKRTKQRAVIQSGWANLGMDRPVDGICFVKYVPHKVLFPQASCIIHHGGAGTTAAACRAGVPSVVIPHLSDQIYWGTTLRRLGVAPKIIHRRDLDEKRLSQRIAEVFSSESMGQKARELAEKVRTEDGVGTAVNLIESFASERIPAKSG